MGKRLCLSLFCGLGGGALGFQREGWETVGVDVDEAASAIARTITRTLDASDEGLLLLSGEPRWVAPTPTHELHT